MHKRINNSNVKVDDFCIKVKILLKQEKIERKTQCKKKNQDELERLIGFTN